MKKKYTEATLRSILLTFGLSFIGVVAAQGQVLREPCGTDREHHRIKELHPEVALYEQQLEAHIERQLRGMNLSQFARTTGVMDTAYHVPVVVHIMHNYGGENISDNDIYKAIREMNDLYNKRNADTIDVIAPYKNDIPGTKVRYIGNTNITFHLAQKDPQGRPTRGITRNRTYLTRNGGHQSKLVQWPPDMYLNIWVVGSFSGAHDRAAAFALKPADAVTGPFLDGPIVAFFSSNLNINNDNTLSHEVGHYFNLDHPWGNTNKPEVACGDDAVDDTPPTRGHMIPDGVADGCSVLSSIYDTVCTSTTNVVLGKPFLDIAHSRITSTSTTEGVNFNAPTAITLNSVRVYPGAAIGSPFTIQLLQNGNPLPGYSVSGTVQTSNDTAQLVPLSWPIAVGSNYKIVFSQNPGMRKDSVYAAYPQSIAGAMVLSNETINGRYNFFYTINIRHGYYKFYDSTASEGYGYPHISGTQTNLIDYPDTVNAQNVMDYTYCSKMFTHGQSLRMRAALNSPIAGRNKLITGTNLFNTGITDAGGNFLPVADLPPVADYSLGTHFNSIGGDVQRSDKVYGCNNTAMFSFTDRSWGDTVSSRQWTFSNGASTPTASAIVINSLSFSQPGWANISLVATSNAGSDTIARDAVYIADGDNPLNAATYYQEFAPGGDNDKFPIFNYFNNQFKWSVVNNAGYYDNYSIRYRSYDDRTGIAGFRGSPVGDYDDFFTPPFNLQPLSSGNCNLNFMYSGAYSTASSAQMNDTFEVFMSVDCGQNWVLLKRLAKGEVSTSGTVNNEFTASAGYAGSDWKLMSISIPTANRVGKALFRFRYRPGVNNYALDAGQRGTGNNFFVDRIHISTFPTGINGAEMDARGFVVAPNPTHEGAKIMLKGERNSVAQVVVTDVTGKAVFRTEKAVTGNMTVIDIPAQSIAVKGIYLVQVATGNNKHTEKLVVY